MSPSRPARVGRWLCLGGAAWGVLGLLGWVLGVGRLTAILPGQPPMMPNTAVGLLLIGAAGALRHRQDAGPVQKTLSLAAAITVLLIGAGTLAEHALGIDLHIDDFVAESWAGPHRGRPSPPTALALTLLGAAVILFDARPTARMRPSEWLVLGAGLAAFMSLTGFVLGAVPLYRLTHTPIIGVALPTSISLLMTSAGMLLERSGAGVMQLVTSPGPGGVLLRRLVPAAILAPPLLALVTTRLSNALGMDQSAVVIAILSATLTVVDLLLLAVTAIPLNRTHEALEWVRARARQLIDAAPDGIFVADLDGRYIDVNDSGCRMLGHTREEILGKTIVDLILPGEVERLWQVRERLLEGQAELSEWTLRCKDGHYIPVEVSATILPDGRWQGFVRDISERKRLENELRLSEAKSSGILAISADAIVSIDEEQRITLFNEGAERIFGYAKAEVLGAPLDILIPERARAAHRRHVASFAAGPQVARRMHQEGVSIVGLRRSGEEFPLEAALSKLEVGGTCVLTAALRDISEQKRIEGEQRFLAELGPVLATTLDYEETLSRIANIAVGSIADLSIVDLVDPGDGAVRRLRVVCHDPSKVWVCHLLERIPPGRGSDFVSTALATRRPVLVQRLSSQDIDALFRGASPAPAAGLQSGMAVPLIAREKLLGAIALLSAIPGRIYGPEDLHMAQELAQRAALAVENARLYRTAQHAIRMRDDVLGIVAHDLRNPLGTIVMQAELMRLRGAEREHRAAELIGRAATRMNRLIQDLLDVARMEAGRLAVEPRCLPSREVLADAVEAQSALASTQTLELVRDWPAELPEVWADRDRLLQVLENLIGNAIKFTPPGGTISVGAEPHEDEVLFWVSDTGPGIAAEDRGHVFESFWQVRAAGRHGAGLGLTIVKGIVEAHGGRVWVESQRGHGSKFFFTIPTAPRAEAWQPERLHSP